LGSIACASCYKPELAFSDGLAVFVAIADAQALAVRPRIERQGRRLRAVDINEQSLIGAPGS
jgi:hypothetical protein